MNETEIRDLIEALGDVRAVLDRAADDDRAAVYRQLGLRLTYAPELRTVRVAIEISAHSWGYGLCPRGCPGSGHPGRVSHDMPDGCTR